MGAGNCQVIGYPGNHSWDGFQKEAEGRKHKEGTVAAVWIEMLAQGLEQDSQYGKDKLLFSCSVLSNSLQSHGLQHARLPCPSPSSGVCPSLCPSNHLILCHPLPSIFPSIRVFSNESRLFASGGQSIGASASASVPSMNVQD